MSRSVRRAVILSLVAFSALLGFASAAADAGTYPIVSGEWPRKGPYLLNTGHPDTMAILWQLDEASECTLAWGETTEEWEREIICTSEFSDHRFAVDVSNLSPDTLYYYRLSHGESSVVSTFRTAPRAEAADVRFIAWADPQFAEAYPRPDGSVTPSCLSEAGDETLRLMAENPGWQTMIALAGDWILFDQPEEDWETFFDIPSVREILTMLPAQGCAGNHDVIAYEEALFEAAGLMASYEALLLDPYLSYWPYPYVDDHYWSFEYGPIHFVVLDQFSEEERQTPFDERTVQYDWLEVDLASNTKPWTIALFHIPLVSRDAYEEPGMYWPNADRMRPLLEGGSVDLLLSGHWHQHNYMEAPIPQLIMGSVSDGRHICKYYTFDIQGDRMTITAYDVGGEIHEIIEIENR